MRKTNAERQQALAERRAAAGMRPHRLWISDSDADQLRVKFEGPRGGIDWQAVIRTALQREAAAPLRKPIAPEPIPYWRPNGQRDPRCQAVTASGQRCRLAGSVISRALDTNGKLGEFTSCPRHAAEFMPHRTVMG